ncbi:nitronate monooxygenase family protein [Halobacillus sp. Marseille-P3879]|uniref:NAD(P)H-dependent flavin oxidoreductase n=1 Tax=Halobacillus sp. Marseille-P3879 TaxID=2045014 RepID=UPI000C7E7744|nr:nitronate monooxygenase [Halobacillus sp. Marseille-P3879]
MEKKNKLTELLNIDYPIIQAGMAGGVTSPELIAAVSNSGALGTLGAGYMSAEAMKDSILQAKKLTDRPFGVNVFIPEFPEIVEEEVNEANDLLEPFREQLKFEENVVPSVPDSQFDKQLEVAVEQQVAVCSFTFGVPSKEVVHDLKRRGIKVIGTATTVEEAVVNEEHGVDAVVAQGSEAGGHRGTFIHSFETSLIGTMSLVPQVVDQVHIPVIAAGGIMDGRGAAASLVLGAGGVQLGTAFVTSTESSAHQLHKEAILRAEESQTVLTRAFSGKPARGIQNAFIEKMKDYESNLPDYPVQNRLTKGIRKQAAKQNNPDFMSLWSGQSPRLSQRKAAGEIIKEIMEEVEKVL